MSGFEELVKITAPFEAELMAHVSKENQDILRDRVSEEKNKQNNLILFFYFTS